MIKSPDFPTMNNPDDLEVPWAHKPVIERPHPLDFAARFLDLRSISSRTIA